MKTLTLTLGKYTSPDSYLAEIKKHSSVSIWAEDIAKQVSVSQQKHTVKVALLTFADLGLLGTKTTQQIKDAALKQGYELPDAEIALALALEELEEQEIGDWWITLHEPIEDSEGGPRVLDASRGGGGRWVSAHVDRPVILWDGRGAFAFLVPASKHTVSNVVRKRERKRPKIRVSKGSPSLDFNEIAIYLTVELPDELFSKPSLKASIKVPKEAVSAPVITAEVVGNVEQIIKQQTGFEVRLEVVPVEENKEN